MNVSVQLPRQTFSLLADLLSLCDRLCDLLHDIDLLRDMDMDFERLILRLRLRDLLRLADLPEKLKLRDIDMDLLRDMLMLFERDMLRERLRLRDFDADARLALIERDTD